MSDPLSTFRDSARDAILTAYPDAVIRDVHAGIMATFPATEDRRAAGIACHMRPGEDNPAKAGAEAAEVAIRGYRGEKDE